MSALELRLPYRTVKARPFPGLAVGLSLLPSLAAALLVFGPPPWRGEVGVLVGLTLLAHLLAFFATDRMARYPGRVGWGLAAFNLLLFTLLLLAVLALGRLYYSRAFLLLATSLAFPLLPLCLPHLPPVRLALLPGGLADRLRSIAKGVRPIEDLEEAEGVVADLHHLDPRALPLLAEASLRGLPILHAAAVYEGYTGRVPLEGGFGEGLLALSEGNRGLYPYFKRPFEVGLVLLFAPLILLLGLLVALLVYLDLGRPVLFAQERMGLGGKPFKAYKFRTMRGAPREGAYAGEEANRVTPLGRFLRRYRLDNRIIFPNSLSSKERATNVPRNCLDFMAFRSKGSHD